jgi:DNA/RNA-binding domain of Phe-tRNA-synthetase-like protein
MTITIDPHPLLEAAVCVARFSAPLGEISSPDWLGKLLSLEAPTSFERSEELRAAVRDMLRFGGYKPTGRGKPAAEYLVRAATEGVLGPINPAVDVCNVVSLNSGLPISVIDLDRVVPPLGIGLAGAGRRYIFNAAGHEIDLEGLLCLHDAMGECANGVKDSERTKTNAETRNTLTVIWGVQGFREVTELAAEWYRELLGRLGARVEEVETVATPVH